MKSLRIIFQQLLGCVATFSAVAVFDYWTGYEWSSSPLYLLPVGLAFFNFGAWGGYIGGVLAAVVWTLVDKWTGRVFSHEFLRWETGFARFIIFALFVWGLSLYRSTLAIHRARIETLRRLIPICHECGKVRGLDGTWKDAAELLEGSNPERLECPDCESTPGSPHV